MEQFKIVNDKRNVGYFMDEEDLKFMIKVSERRNAKYHKRFLDIYEYLVGHKYNNNKNKKRI